MIVWHAHGRDTWYSGRFIEAWADERVLARLPQTFALPERDSLQRALRAMLDLFRLLGEEVAARWGFTYPATVHDQITALAGRLFEEPS